MNDYTKMKATLEKYLTEFKKEAEATDPNETKADEVGSQGEAGKAMTKEIQDNLPAGTAVGGVNSTAGTSDGEPKVVNPVTPQTSEDPGDDMALLDANTKKAHAAQIRFEAGLINMIDQLFEAEAAKTAAEQAAKTASAPRTTSSVEEAARAWRVNHVEQVMKAFGLDAKRANEIVDALAETDPAAVLPPEALTDGDADAILAAAAEADAQAALGEGDGADGGEEDEAAAVEAIAEALGELQESGLSQDEAIAAILEEVGATPEDLAEIVVENLHEQGLGDEEITNLAATVEGLQAEGATPEEIMAALSGEPEGAE